MIEEYGLPIAAFKGKHSLSLRRFARGLLRKAENLWVFTRTSIFGWISFWGAGQVEPTNNQAERDLRGIVIARKISYGSKSNRGDRFVERINSVVDYAEAARARVPELSGDSPPAPGKRARQLPPFFTTSC